MVLTVGSLFAGIGGFDLGFERAGCSVRWQAEQDGKAQSVLSARFPNALLHDDVRAIDDLSERVDVICGGFPCQDVSVAGKREGLGGARTGLFWEVVRIARALQPRWMVLENVPGLLSSRGGRDFHAVLAALAECGFRRTYRILDSRYFGVAQRRRRVFLVLRLRGCGDGADTVLFEPASGGGDSQAGQETGARVAATLRGRSHGAGVNAPGRGGEDDQNLVAFGWNKSASQGLRCDSEATDAIQASPTSNPAIYQCHGSNVGPMGTLRAGNGNEGGGVPFVVATLNSGGNSGGFRTEPGEHLICAPTLNQRMRGPTDNMMDVLSAMSQVVPERARALVGSMFERHDDDTDTLIPTLTTSLGHHGHGSPRGDGNDPIVAFTLSARPHGIGQGHNTTYPGGVRRLTPLECERLQGFPDGWTCLCGNGHRGSSFCSCADSPRYKQLGNAVTVPVAEWIARRIVALEERTESNRAEPAVAGDSGGFSA